MNSNPNRRGAGLPLLMLYTAAVFVSAFLLFLVQPMFGKMVLPLLGGSPAVWNTCMLFFQVALLGGYLYAHLTSRWLEPRRQWMLHLALLTLALLALPISVAGAAPDPEGSPIPWLLRLMLLAVGAPFLALAATGPMLQRWFARTGHPDASEPYHLYAASNLGSMLALLAYPLAMEPTLRLAAQTRGWTIGFVVLALLIAGCGAWGWTRPRDAVPVPVESEPEEAEDGVAEEAVEEAAGEPAPLTVKERALWVALAFVPSTMLLGVTSYITTDLTPAPLLWVLPLALYLLSFTLVFAKRRLIPHGWMLAAQPAILAATVILLQRTEHMANPAIALPLHLANLFVTAMVCHGELSRRRPHVRYLTEFYLWVSVGGALGGVFNVLLAPVLFARLWEYPLALVAACLVRPWPTGRFTLRRNLLWGARAVAFAFVLIMMGRPSGEELPVVVFVILASITVYLLAAALRFTPLWLAVCIGGAVAARLVAEVSDPRVLYAHRSFYGQFRVNRSAPFTVLQHGSTLHGAQNNLPSARRDPITYYLRRGPLGSIFSTMGVSNRNWRVAVVGLGTGTAAAYAMEGDDWTFYEINPAIERAARDTSWFSYLHDAPAPIRVVLGDARLSLARYEGPPYDLIVLDAFSSDAIPVHLLTREAMQLYLSRLAPGGRIAIHISNRYLDLEPVVAALAEDAGLDARIASGPQEENDARYENSSTWVAVARSPTDLELLTTMEGGWLGLHLPEGFRPWSDDFSSLWTVMKW